MVRVITLDETGQFENRKKGIRFVGGFIGDISSVVEEEAKIEKLLSHVCETFNKEKMPSNHQDWNVVYPKSLHGSGKTFFLSAGGRNRWDAVPNTNGDYRITEKSFNRFLEEQVIGYLKENQYELYAFIDPYTESDDGYKEMDGKSNIVSVRQGANLYERMAVLSLYNQVFYNIGENAKEYSFQLATRTLNGGKEELVDLYDNYENSRGDKKSTITNTSTYKTAFSTMLYEKNAESEYLNAAYHFNVKSINYDNVYDKKTPFQYLADIVCSYMRTLLQKKFDINKDTVENKITSAGLIELSNAHNMQIRLYDEVEPCFRNMVQDIKQARLVDYFAQMYELDKMNVLYKDFYQKIWIPKLEAYFKDMLQNNVSYREKFIALIPEYYTATDGYMGIREVAYEKGMFIADKICAIVQDIKEYRDRNKYIFKLYDVILRGYNHRGSIAESKKYIQECEKYKMHVGIEDYIAHTLRNLVFYFNSFDYQTALETGIELEKSVKKLATAYNALYTSSNKISSNIIGDEDENDMDLKFVLAGKVYSSIGQAYGFLKKYKQGQKYFEKALDNFEKNSMDYHITLSHYLQLLFASGDKKEYERNTYVYFTTEDLWKQMENAFSVQDGGFTILIYTKAFNVFYAKDQSYNYILEELIQKISAIEDSKKKAHPWELIYMNLYESVVKQKMDVTQHNWIKEKAISDIIDSDTTIQILQIGFKCRLLMQDEKAKESFAEECFNSEELALCEPFVENCKDMTFEEFAKALQDKLTYSYN